MVVNIFEIESEAMLQKFVQAVQQDCQPFLQQAGDQSLSMYRGMGETNQLFLYDKKIRLLEND